MVFGVSEKVVGGPGVLVFTNHEVRRELDLVWGSRQLRRCEAARLEVHGNSYVHVFAEGGVVIMTRELRLEIDLTECVFAAEGLDAGGPKRKYVRSLGSLYPSSGGLFSKPLNALEV